MTERVLKSEPAVPTCRLEVGKYVVGLTFCTDHDPYGCPDRYHRVFAGRVKLQTPDSQWLIDGSGQWWFGTFDKVLITIPAATDADELTSCMGHTTSPLFPLSAEGMRMTAKQLITQLKINNETATEGGGFERMDDCPICDKLRVDETAFLSVEEVRVNASSLLLPQYAVPIRQLLRSNNGLCMSH